MGRGLSLPCGRCIGCRLERSRQWAVRLMHESKMHAVSSFLTLTYKDLPPKGSLSVEHCQLFMKRLRARLAPKKVRFFLCGEYGDQFGRPHYHAILFGEDFAADRVKLSEKNGFYLYESKLLDEVWGHGGCRIGDVTFDSAAYVANYATKKVTGAKADEHYQGRKPEFLLMSRGGRGGRGIGHSWFEKFASDVYPADAVIVSGREARPPRYYDGLLEEHDPALAETIKSKRVLEASVLDDFVLRSGEVVKVAESNNAYRLEVREKVARAKLALKRRNLENNNQ